MSSLREKFLKSIGELPHAELCRIFRMGGTCTCGVVKAQSVISAAAEVVERTEWLAARFHKYECSGDDHSYPCLEYSNALAALEQRLSETEGR